MPTVALVTAVAATGLDDDLAPLYEACRRAGLQARCLAWDDATIHWGRFDAVVLRSPWDYTERYKEFLSWCEAVDRASLLLNPLHVVRWNSDKHYLSDLAVAGIHTVASTFVEPDAEPLPSLQAFLSSHAAGEFVVKPVVSAGSRDTQRYARGQDFAASNHIARLLDEGRSVLLQPYLASVDSLGETALVYIDGTFSHAIRKGPLLRPDEGATDALFAPEAITPRVPGADELALGQAVLQATTGYLGLGQPLPYARIDLIRDPAGQPCLLELELTEPSLFFTHAAGSADAFAMALSGRLGVG